jgi:hypothetical protein
MTSVMWKRFSYAFAAVVVMTIALVAKDVRTISIRDDCDQATFDAAVGEGTCVGDGDTTFEEFLAALADGGHPKWRFNNSVTEADVAANAKNEGGEGHTFTPVARFGGGFIRDLNMGQDPVPECVQLVNGQPIPATLPLPNGGQLNIFVPSAAVDATTVPAGEQSADMPLKRGANRFQCCIHPWMRSTVTRR